MDPPSHSLSHLLTPGAGFYLMHLVILQCYTFLYSCFVGYLRVCFTVLGMGPMFSFVLLTNKHSSTQLHPNPHRFLFCLLLTSYRPPFLPGHL